MSTFSIDPTGARISVVVGDPGRRQALCVLLRKIGYRAHPQPDLADGALIDGRDPDLTVIDLDGADRAVLALLTADRRPPAIGVTADGSSAGRRRAAATGVVDFLVRPLEPAELRLRLDNALGTGRLRRLLNDRSARLTEALREHSEEVGTVRESLSVLAAIADFHDEDTDQHAHRVGVMSGAIARALHLPEAFATRLAEAAPLHDIGKVGLSRRILLKPGKLTPSEWMHMQQHVDIGGQILATARSPVLVLAAEIARTHHERFDGSGYTAGLSGEEIPLSGRIVAVADVWDTLTHDRPYRAAWTHERALTEIHEQSGAHFDPAVVEAFSSLMSDPDDRQPAGDASPV